MIYTITKYAQSCILIEKEGKRCLIDPGRFVYERDDLQAKDWPKIDLLLITHGHSDHADVDGIRTVVKRDRCPVYTNARFAAELADQGIVAAPLTPGETITEGGFIVHAVLQQHGDLLNGQPAPEVVGFLIDGSTLYDPGDSILLPTMPHADVFFVPVAGPQMTLETARAMAQHVQPKVAIPVHFSNTEKYPITIDEIRTLNVPGVDVRVLADKASMQWSAGM